MSEQIQYFRIKNWDKYQENPRKPGIKFTSFFLDAAGILDDPKVYNMTALQFMIWIKLLAIARQLDNLIPLDSGWIAVRTGVFRLKQRVNLEFLWVLGLVEAVDPLCRLGKDRLGKVIEASPQAAQVLPKKTSLSELCILTIWNENCAPLPTAEKITQKRLSAWKQRLAENSDQTYWVGAVKKLAQSEFCRGNNDRHWIANIDFFLRPDTHIKISEGSYGTKIKPVNNRLVRTSKSELQKKIEADSIKKIELEIEKKSKENICQK